MFLFILKEERANYSVRNNSSSRLHANDVNHVLLMGFN